MRQKLSYAPIGIFLFYLLVNFPGSFNEDSVLVFSQSAQIATMTNWHSPLLVHLWWVLSLGGNDPRLIFISQTALISLIFGKLIGMAPTTWKKIILIMLFLLPQSVIVAGYVSKDTFIAIFTVISFLDWNLPKRIKYLPNVIALVLVASLRITNIFLLLPGLIHLSQKIKNSDRRKTQLRKWTQSLFILISILTFGYLLNIPNSGRHLHPENIVKTWDLTAISLDSNKNLIPQEFQREPKCSLTEMKTQYTTLFSDPLIWNENSCSSLILPERYNDQVTFYNEKGEYSQKISTKYWIDQIISNPKPYLEHRLKIIARMLLIPNSPIMYPSSPNSSFIGINKDQSLYPGVVLHNIFPKYNFAYSVHDIANPGKILMVPGIWLLGVLLLLIRKARRETSKKQIVIFLSMLGYVMTIGFTSPGPEFRYLYPIWYLSIYSFVSLTKNQYTEMEKNEN